MPHQLDAFCAAGLFLVQHNFIKLHKKMSMTSICRMERMVILVITASESILVLPTLITHSIHQTNFLKTLSNAYLLSTANLPTPIQVVRAFQFLLPRPCPPQVHSLSRISLILGVHIAMRELQGTIDFKV